MAEFKGEDKRKTEGWFSRRHRTRAEHEARMANYHENRGPKARRRRAAERLAKWEAMTPEQRMAQKDRNAKAAGERLRSEQNQRLNRYA